MSSFEGFCIIVMMILVVVIIKHGAEIQMIKLDIKRLERKGKE